jgi:SAM-dependent methyltransferase
MQTIIADTATGARAASTHSGGNGMNLILSEQSKEQFAASQVEMTRTWFNNLLQSGRNVEDYIAQRKAAYLGRWREAGRYIGAGGRVLDVGGGNIYDEMLDYIRSMNWDYWYADVGADETAHAQRLGASFGFDPAHFSRRLNHELTYEAGFFDAVFSSHCVEHSMDLRLTLRQLNSILKPGGNAIISVPFGWDPQPCHPYFLMENEWLTLIEDAGFRVRAYQIGSEYPESGQDLMIAAEKTGPIGDTFRLDVERYIKSSYRFIPYGDPSIRLFGRKDEKEGHVILDGADWRIEIALEAGTVEALPIFIPHHWSGKVALRSGADAVHADLFRPFPTFQPLRLTLSAPAEAGQILEARPDGKSEMSLAAQGVFVGVMTR